MYWQSGAHFRQKSNEIGLLRLQRWKHRMIDPVAVMGQSVPRCRWLRVGSSAYWKPFLLFLPISNEHSPSLDGATVRPRLPGAEGICRRTAPSQGKRVMKKRLWDAAYSLQHPLSLPLPFLLLTDDVTGNRLELTFLLSTT